MGSYLTVEKPPHQHNIVLSLYLKYTKNFLLGGFFKVDTFYGISVQMCYSIRDLQIIISVFCFLGLPGIPGKDGLNGTAGEFNQKVKLFV